MTPIINTFFSKTGAGKHIPWGDFVLEPTVVGHQCTTVRHLE